jgi:hypothetical protein
MTKATLDRQPDSGSCRWEELAREIETLEIIVFAADPCFTKTGPPVEAGSPGHCHEWNCEFATQVCLGTWANRIPPTGGRRIVLLHYIT